MKDARSHVEVETELAVAASSSVVESDGFMTLLCFIVTSGRPKKEGGGDFESTSEL